MKLAVQSRSGRAMCELLVGEKTTITQLKNLFAIKCPKFYPDRQRFTTIGTPAVALADGKSVGDYNLKDGDVIVFKDLGPQVSWTTVFVIEYAGPLFLWPIFYFGGYFIYGKSVVHDYVQTLALYCWSLHFAKRVLETLFVHRFSHATMPFTNIFKNCGHYWGAALYIAYFVNHPDYTAPPMNRVYLGLTIFLLSELGNLISHIQLRNLRSEGSTDRQIPRGFMFEFVSCPNYTFEVSAWVGFSIMVHTLTSYLFMLLGFFQMWVWAVQKHRRYKKEFDGKEGRKLYPKNRKVMIPFIA